MGLHALAAMSVLWLQQGTLPPTHAYYRPAMPPPPTPGDGQTNRTRSFCNGSGPGATGTANTHRATAVLRADAARTRSAESEKAIKTRQAAVHRGGGGGGGSPLGSAGRSVRAKSGWSAGTVPRICFGAGDPRNQHTHSIRTRKPPTHPHEVTIADQQCVHADGPKWDSQLALSGRIRNKAGRVLPHHPPKQATSTKS